MNRLRSALCLVCLWLPGCILYVPIDLGSLGGPGDLEETLVLGEDGPKIALIEISIVCQQQSDDFQIPIPGSSAQWRVMIRVAIDVGTSFQKHSRSLVLI